MSFFQCSPSCSFPKTRLDHHPHLIIQRVVAWHSWILSSVMSAISISLVAFMRALWRRFCCHMIGFRDFSSCLTVRGFQCISGVLRIFSPFPFCLDVLGWDLGPCAIIATDVSKGSDKTAVIVYNNLGSTLLVILVLHIDMYFYGWSCGLVASGYSFHQLRVTSSSLTVSLFVIRALQTVMWSHHGSVA